MSIHIVIAGQIRSPGLLVKLVEDAGRLLQDGRCQRVLVVTWSYEVRRLPWITPVLARYGAELVCAEPVPVDTYRNYLRQQRLLSVALEQVRPDDVVVKLRTDWVIGRDHLEGLCRAPSPVTAPAGLRRMLRGRVTVPWWSTRVPFHLADESLVGYAEDLARFNNPDARMALADPHAGRYLPYLERQLGVLRVVDHEVFPQITASGRDPARVVRALGGDEPAWPPRAVRRRRWPGRFAVTTAALESAAYQRALACYYLTLDWLFEVWNPTPAADQFIERHGPWSVTTPDVTEAGDPLQSPDPICYVPAARAKVASRVPSRYGAFHEAVSAFTADPALMLPPPSTAGPAALTSVPERSGSR